MKNALKKIWEFIKNHVGIVLAAIGALFGGLFIGLRSNKTRGLDPASEICKSAASGVAKTSESITDATGKLSDSERVVGELKQSISDSETGLSDCSSTLGELIRSANDIAAILDKYDTGVKQTTEAEQSP